MHHQTVQEVKDNGKEDGQRMQDDHLPPDGHGRRRVGSTVKEVQRRCCRIVCWGEGCADVRFADYLNVFLNNKNVLFYVQDGF